MKELYGMINTKCGIVVTSGRREEDLMEERLLRGLNYIYMARFLTVSVNTVSY